MNLKTKSFILWFVIFILIFQIIHFLLTYFFRGLNGMITAALSGFLTAFLAPQINTVDTQNGKKFQLNWNFIKLIKHFKS